jgi:hypothetical protein
LIAIISGLRRISIESLDRLENYGIIRCGSTRAGSPITYICSNQQWGFVQCPSREVAPLLIEGEISVSIFEHIYRCMVILARKSSIHKMKHIITKIIVSPEIRKVSDEGCVVQNTSDPWPVGLNVIVHCRYVSNPFLTTTYTIYLLLQELARLFPHTQASKLCHSTNE